MNWLCKKFKVSKCSYYSHFKTKQKQNAKWAKLDEAVLKIYHRNNGVLGYRKIHAEITDDNKLDKQPQISSAFQILKAMRRLNIRSIVQRKPKPKEYICNEAASDLVKGASNGFTRDNPNLVWYGDFTYQKVDGVNKYICAIIDAYGGEVIARKVSNNIDTKLAIETLQAALSKRNYPKNVIFHSDQGAQYTSKQYGDFCTKNNVIQSMSRKGKPTDNAMMESFMGKLKTEKLKHYTYKTNHELEEALFTYCEWYNTKRKKQSLGYLTIKEYCQVMLNS